MTIKFEEVLDVGLPVGYTTVSCPEIKCDHNFAVSSVVRLAQGFGGRHVEGNTG